MKKLILLLGICSAYADNQALFNSAMTAGSQNQVNMNLNQNSTVDSYGQTNKFDPAVAQNANAGNAPAKEMFSHISGNNPDNNYLYNSGTAAIQDCMNKKDPRCTTLNKYGDKDTQTQLQAYAQGISSRYAITIKPDPNNSACSNLITKSPINPETLECMSGRNAQNSCQTTLEPYTNSVPAKPSDWTIIASGSTISKACEGAEMRSNATITAIEALTKSNQTKLHIENTGNNKCGNWNPKNLDINLPMSSYSSEIYNNDDRGCGGGHWDNGGIVKVSGGCQGNSCSYVVDVEASHGGNCWDKQHTYYNLNFNKPVAGYVDSGVNFTDNCSQYK